MIDAYVYQVSMTFSSNEIYFCTSGSTKKYSLLEDKAYVNKCIDHIKS